MEQHTIAYPLMSISYIMPYLENLLLNPIQVWLTLLMSVLNYRNKLSNILTHIQHSYHFSVVFIIVRVFFNSNLWFIFELSDGIHKNFVLFKILQVFSFHFLFHLLPLFMCYFQLMKEFRRYIILKIYLFFITMAFNC